MNEAVLEVERRQVRIKIEHYVTVCINRRAVCCVPMRKNGLLCQRFVEKMISHLVCTPYTEHTIHFLFIHSFAFTFGGNTHTHYLHVYTKNVIAPFFHPTQNINSSFVVNCLRANKLKMSIKHERYITGSDANNGSYSGA